MKKWAIGLSLILLQACATSKPNPEGLNLMSEDEYEKVMETYSDKIQVYSGLENIIDMTGTIINSAVAQGQMDQNARMYQWDAAKYTTEKVKMDEQMQKEATLFLSFYTPERKHDELHKNETLWKIFLDVNGKRFEVKAKKIKLLTEEIRGLYPYHSRFATPYLITFPVAMKSIENSNSQMTITGPVGSGKVKFKSR